MASKSTALPSYGWRILSFVPGLNWLSVLYIGVKNQNTASVICGVLYGIGTYAAGMVAASFAVFILWLAAVCHYARAYRSMEKQMEQQRAEASDKARALQSSKSKAVRRISKDGKPASTPIHADITLPGASQRTQAIPTRAMPDAVQVHGSFSTYDDNERFFADMKKYASIEGRPADFVPFMCYWPTYDKMNLQQRIWYFYWRGQFRAGNCLDTDLSYIFIYIYELLSGVGWASPQEGYDCLMKVWSQYRSKFPNLDRYMSEWTFDFAYQHKLPHDVSFQSDAISLYPSTQIDRMVDQQAGDIPLKLPFALIDALCDYSLVKSKFYKEGNQALVQEAIPRVVALADAMLTKKTQKGILATYGPKRLKKQEHYLYKSAVCPQANKKIEISVKAYSTSARLRGYINELVRYGENTLREIKGSRGRLRGIALDEETAKLVQAFLKREYSQDSKAALPADRKATVSLDFESIDALREQSNAVRTALKVDEIDQPMQKALLTDLQEVTAIYGALSADARKFLIGLEKTAWEREADPCDDAYIKEVNRASERYLGCALLVKEGTVMMVEDDYRDELAHVCENPPQIAEAAQALVDFDCTVLSPELQDFVEALMPQQQKVLSVLLTSQHPQSELEIIAEEEMSMPQMLLDDINELAMRVFGDLIVDCTQQEPRILQDYVVQLEQSIA